MSWIRRFLALDDEPKQETPDLGEVSYADPFRLFARNLFTQFNPSSLVSRHGLKVFDQMRNDDQIKAALTFKKLAVLCSGWEVSSPEGEDEDWEPAKFATETLNRIDGTLEEALRAVLTCLDYGFSVSEKVWEIEDTEWGPRTVIRALKTRKPHLFQLRCDPFGNLFDDGVVQMQPKGWVNLPADKFVVAVHQKEFDNWYGRSDLEAAYRAWWTKDNSYKWLGMFLERLGIPPMIYMYNSKGLAPDQIRDITTLLQNLQAATSAAIPRANKDSGEFFSPELGAQVGSVFIPSIEMFNKDMSRAILMPAEVGATPQAEGGSRARASVHFDMFMLVVEALQNFTANLVQEQIVKPLTDFNYPVDRYPVFKFLAIEDDVKMDLFNTWMGLTTGGIVGRSDKDEAHIRKQMGFPPREMGEGEAPNDPNEPAEGEPPEDGEGGDGQSPERGKGRPSAESAAAFALSRQPNRYERKVDFKAISGRMDRIEASAHAGISSALSDSMDDVVRQIERRFDPADPKSVSGIGLRKLASLRAAIGSMLQGSFDNGGASVRGEIPARRFKTGPMFDPRAARQFLANKQVQVAGILTDRLNAQIKQVLSNAMKSGETQRETVGKIEALFIPYIGDDSVLEAGEPLAPYQLETLIRTNVTEAFNQGRIVEARKAGEYLTGFLYSAILDDRTTPVCAELDGLVIKAGDPAVDKLAPPRHFNCRSLLVPITIDQPVAAEDFATPSQVAHGLELSGKGFV